MQKRFELKTKSVLKIVEYQSDAGIDTQSEALEEILESVDVAKLLKVKKK